MLRLNLDRPTRAALVPCCTMNKSDISYLKTSLAFDVLIHSGKPNSVYTKQIATYPVLLTRHLSLAVLHVTQVKVR